MADRRGRTSIRAAAPFLAAAVGLAACTSTPSPTSVPATASPAVTAAPSTAASLGPPSVAPPPSAEPAETQASGAAECEPADIKASHGRVEGAAGSIFTTVVLSPGFACSIDLYPAFGLRDANGAVLVGGAAGGSGRIDLDPELSYETAVRLANWCADDPVFPLRFELLLGGGASEEVTGGSFPEDGDVPPCNGEGARRVLEASSWEAAFTAGS
jgi:hypothetical protein